MGKADNILTRQVLPWFYALLLHGALLALLTVSVMFSPKAAPLASPEVMAIEATVVDEGRIEQEMARLDELEQQAREREAERQRQLDADAERARLEREQEEQRLADVERERQQQEAEAAERREQERVAAEQREAQRLADEQAATERAAELKRQQERADELKRQQEEEAARLAAAEEARREAERQREAEEKRLAELREQQAAEEETRRREAEARAEAEAQARREAELQEQLLAAISEEEQARKAEEAGLLSRWKTLIQQKVQRNWARPPSAGSGLACDVAVRQIPGGEVVEVKVTKCNGDAAVIRSIEAAVYKASPLPPPDDPTLFQQNLILKFEPE